MTPKLLLADDSVTIQRVIELTFADENVQVIAVGDGQQAIERIRADRPDVVLADIGMPERDGYEVAAFVKGTPEFAHIPVLLLTGAFEPVDDARARAVGCEGVLVKPFEPQMVITRVRELLSRRPAPGDQPVQPQPQGTAASHLSKAPAAAGQPPARSGAAEQPPAAPQEPGSLEDYFDRLDAALATLSTAPPAPLEPPRVVPERPAARPWPPDEHASMTVVSNSGEALAPVEADPDAARPPQPAVLPPRPHATPQPAVAAQPAAEEPRAEVPLHEAFAALLAAEQQRPLAPAAIVRDVLSESAIDEIVRRVVDRMRDDDMRRVVLDAAERLVREEIDRIKSLR